MKTFWPIGSRKENQGWILIGRFIIPDEWLNERRVRVYVNTHTLTEVSLSLITNDAETLTQQNKNNGCCCISTLREREPLALIFMKTATVSFVGSFLSSQVPELLILSGRPLRN